MGIGTWVRRLLACRQEHIKTCLQYEGHAMYLYFYFTTAKRFSFKQFTLSPTIKRHEISGIIKVPSQHYILFEHRSADGLA
jgi:hypothetical protein